MRYPSISKVVCLGLLNVTACRSQPAADNTIEGARAAFMRQDFRAAEVAFRDVFRSDTSRANRAEARATIADILWRIRGRQDSALAVLKQETPGDSSTRPLLQLSRLLRETGDAPGALESGRRALTFSRNAADSAASLSAMAESALKDSSQRAAVLTALVEFVRAHPGRLDPARLIVELGARQAEGPATLLGWNSYYLNGIGDTTSGPLALPRRVLARVLPTWRGNDLGTDERRELIRALRDSRFFDAAAALITPADTTVGDVRDLQAYVDYLHKLRSVTNDYYMHVARGDASKRQWEKGLDGLARALWQRLSWATQSPSYSTAAFESEIGKRFGAHVTKGETSGTSDLHFGHAVVDTRRTVSQHGQSAAIRFIALDAMASNGYQSWAWDGRAGHGGWATADFIAQVRPLYAESAIRAWVATSDSAARGKEAQRIAVDSARDVATATKTPIAGFPSVAARLERDERRRMLDSLRSSGLSGSPLQATFERLFSEAELESSIFAHEGRHAIDAQMGVKGSTADREYRAKLSQVVFAPRPRLGVEGAIAVDPADKTAHGEANLRIVTGLLAWLGEHKAEIRGLDPSLPLFPQLPLLSDQQLRDAFQSLDPLLKRGSGAT